MENVHEGHGDLIRRHLYLLFLFGILLRFLVAFLALLTSYLPSFDSSASILLNDKDQSLLRRLLATTFRWDAFHFLHVAQNGYEFEYEWAFFPGVPLLSHLSGFGLNLMKHQPSIYTMLAGQYILSFILTPESARVLYLLTLQHTRSPNLAFLSACMSLLSSSPPALTLGTYAEPWFALLSYKGMLRCAQRRWVWASIFFFLASMFRSNGIFLGGFIFWGMVIEPFMAGHPIGFVSISSGITLSIFPVLPFIGFQVAGYRSFCTYGLSLTPSWCARNLPLIYNYVQSQYWNNGFLRYWTFQQLPNFLLAGPMLLLLLYSSVTHILFIINIINVPLGKHGSTLRHPLVAPSILPHAIHALILTCLLLFASHTQIILRLASSMPFTYWSAARLFDERPKWARRWVWWSVVWGAISIVLWTTFLPPA